MVLVFVGLLLVGILVTAALVLDIGAARSRATSAQSAADLAALAGGRSLGTNQPLAACEDAVRNVATNLPEIKSISPTSFCSTMGTTSCSGGAGTQVKPETTVGTVTLRVTYPVFDADITDAKAPGPWINDGSACQRMTVTLTVNDKTAFAQVVGTDKLTVRRSATVRGTLGTGPSVPALWLLDPTGCTPLNVSGGSKVTVGVTGTNPIPGIIAVDSDGTTCQSNQVTVSAGGTGTALTAVPTTGDTTGQILLYAMPPGATNCTAPACSQSDVSSNRLGPLPINAPNRSTRSPVDWRYNCKTSYPAYHGIAIVGCPTGTPPYISNLRTAIGASGQPAGFNKWSSTYSCNPAGTITAAGNWWIDCNNGLAIGNGTKVTFSGGNVVMDKPLNMTGGDLIFNGSNPTASLPSSCLPPTVQTPCTTTSSAKAAWVYERNGEWKLTGGQLTVNKTAVIMDGGYLQVAGGSPPIWNAPTEGPFSGLAYWSENSSNKYSMAGGAGVQLSGVFFTPEAQPFSLTGGGVWGQQAAQFISYQFAVSGGGSVTLSPDQSLIGIPVAAGLLIR